jgi:hypothetical protein
MSLKRVLLFSLCILVLSGLVGCRETEMTVKWGYHFENSNCEIVSKSECCFLKDNH